MRIIQLRGATLALLTASKTKTTTDTHTIKNVNVNCYVYSDVCVYAVSDVHVSVCSDSLCLN